MGDFVLMVVPAEPLVVVGRKLKLTAETLPELVEAAMEEEDV